jgi:hypothetical protein
MLYLLVPINPWEKLIGHVETPPLPLWAILAVSWEEGILSCSGFGYDIRWSSEVQRRAKLDQNDPIYDHINYLEFVVVIIQFMAVIVGFEIPLPL